MSFKKDLSLLCRPYYLFNILLSLSYVTAKKLPFFCTLVFPAAECELDSRESEILFFLMIVVMLRTRKAGSVTMINYLSSSFIYAKVANLILWFYADVRLGILYGVVFVLCALILPEPTYTGPENLTYFRTVASLDEELEKEKRITWVVTFYTAWNPSCINFAPIFAQLSHEYHLENLKFGKIDIGRYPDAAKKYRINDSASSQQLPTIILFKEGKEALRRPTVDNCNKLVRFFFTEDNVKLAFDLNNIYQHCKSNPLKKKERKKDDLKTNSTKHNKTE